MYEHFVLIDLNWARHIEKPPEFQDLWTLHCLNYAHVGEFMGLYKLTLFTAQFPTYLHTRQARGWLGPMRLLRGELTWRSWLKAKYEIWTVIVREIHIVRWSFRRSGCETTSSAFVYFCARVLIVHEYSSSGQYVQYVSFSNKCGNLRPFSIL